MATARRHRALILVYKTAEWGDGFATYVTTAGAWDRLADSLCDDWGISRREAGPEPIHNLGVVSRARAQRVATALDELSDELGLSVECVPLSDAENRADLRRAR
jgi:hypothetical protein